MGDYVHKPGRFTVFLNNKGENPNRPDFTGEGVDPDGRPFKASIWRKQGAKGEFLSGNIEYKTDVKPVPKEAPKPHTAKADGFPDDSDTIPF